MMKQCFRLAVIVIGLAMVLNINSATAADGVAKPKALLFFGVYTQWYKFDQILKDCEVKTVNARTDRVESFPSPNELSGYSLVILSDVTADSHHPFHWNADGTAPRQADAILAMGRLEQAHGELLQGSDPAETGIRRQ